MQIANSDVKVFNYVPGIITQDYTRNWLMAKVQLPKVIQAVRDARVKGL